MFENAVPLSAEAHRDLRYKPIPDFSFSAGSTSAPVTYTEMLVAAKYYPLVFPKQGTPVVLLGFEGRNAFVDDQGQWTAPYMPQHVGRYPFILGNSDKPGEMMVLVAPDAPQFKTDGGEKLFDDEGNETAVLGRIKDYLRKFQQEAKKSEQLTRQLHDAEILEEKVIQRKQGQATQTMLTSFYVVDQDKFNALPDETILAWRRNGTLPLVYAHLLSLGNLSNLLPEKSDHGD